MAQPLSLEEFRIFAEAFAADHLTAYTDVLIKKGHNPGRKEINDALWGTISLSGAEVAVLDSPLLQRLRLIRQLGVVHWVYPGAIHTRFEHTLGVVRQVEYLTAAIDSLGAQQGLRDLIPQSKVNLLRLAALLHDVGHAAFSHVSEHAIDLLDALSSIPVEFGTVHRAEQRSLSEIFAYFVVQSPAMSRLMGVLLDHDSDYIKLNNQRAANVKEVIDKVSRAIVGRSIDDRLPLLHEVISGPFDADKLDYFVRDARNAGTPSLLDISRLVQKIALRELPATDLPGNTGRDIKAQDRHVLVGIKWSGISVLDELHLSRVLLYAKIYRHPKVVAIEQMVRTALVMLAAATDVRAVLNLVYRHNDDELLSMTAPVLAVALSVDLATAAPAVVERINKASAILLDLRTRRLTAKVFQLQRTYPGGNQNQDEDQKHGLIEFREVIEQPQEREVFRIRLIAEVEKILDALGEPKRSRVDLEGSIMLHPIGKTPGGTQIGRAYLITKTGSPIEFKDYLVNRTAWADSYLSDQPAGYAFADPDIADAVFVAIEKLLRIDHGIILPESALEMSKRDPDYIGDLKARLKDRGYYETAPFDIRPEPSRLAHADIARAIAEFKPKYDAFQAPVEQDHPSHKQEAKAATKRWLRQFDSDDHLECAVRVLSALRMINRADTVDAVRKFIQANPSFQGSVVIPFGSARDSGAVHGYFAADLKGKLISECLNLDDAFQQRGGRPIIFLDDFVGSGGQTKDILAAGFGRDDLRASLGEDRNLFSIDIQNFLKDSRIGFVFTAAWDDGVAEVGSITEKLGLSATVYRNISEQEIPFLSQALEGLPERQVEAFMIKSAQIGAELLQAESKRKTDESEEQYRARLAGRALGYGNRAMLLASPFNVPTQTFTPLWAWGKTNGVEWTPLLPRRKKR
ncbi:HD domain-containing protein [Rhizobium rhizogenes]|uniref:phosphoribosyltransferase-like protein n=1 Tax=Rhizobium rhizogenes TaxID=359 RepID=UPI0022B6871A|nr:HD domain-containing protein [Rhizobium rhizogenes]MCZ7448134.1 HD domain-containing protein [Rhizobium rhizogenes]MCZ7465795.1 HD domain-containing protein [Rhizobium rhizogenes]